MYSQYSLRPRNTNHNISSRFIDKLHQKNFHATMDEMESHAMKVLGRSGTRVKVEPGVQEPSYEAIDGTNLEEMAETCEVQRSGKSLELYESTSQLTDNTSGPLRCRLCASPSAKMVDIFNSYRTNDLLRKIEYCLRIVVRETDVLPKRVCRLCLGELELCYQFQKTVAEAEDKLLAFSRQTCGKLETENNSQTSSLCIGQHDVTEYDDIEETFKTPPNVEEVRTTNTTPTINPLLACLKPCSVILVPTEVTNSNDLNKHRRNSSHIKLTNSGQKSALNINQPETNDLKVSRITANWSRTDASETSSSHCRERFERPMIKQENPEIHGTGRTRKKRAFKCNLCPKLFLSKGSLTRHNKIHTGIGLHSCEYCGKKCTGVAEKNRHQRIHTGERPFKCSICEKSFHFLHVLQGHASVHTDKREYPCLLCNKYFKSARIRNRHVAYHKRTTPCNVRHREKLPSNIQQD